jgi:flavorubredoxin
MLTLKTCPVLMPYFWERQRTITTRQWSGEAPKFLLEIMKNRFEMRVTEPPLLAKYVPDEKMLGMCRDFGKRVSETLMH